MSTIHKTDTDIMNMYLQDENEISRSRLSDVRTYRQMDRKIATTHLQVEIRTNDVSQAEKMHTSSEVLLICREAVAVAAGWQ